jgi:hypothetical protein
VTPWQEVAFAHPCRLAEETAHPRFARRIRQASLVLTINSGYE